MAAAAGGLYSTRMRIASPDVQFVPRRVRVRQCGGRAYAATAPLTTTISSAVFLFQRLNSTAPKLHPRIRRISLATTVPTSQQFVKICSIV